MLRRVKEYLRANPGETLHEACLPSIINCSGLVKDLVLAG